MIFKLYHYPAGAGVGGPVFPCYDAAIIVPPGGNHETEGQE